MVARWHQNPVIRWLSLGAFALALAVMLFHFSVYVGYAINLMQFPFDYDQGEGFELVDVMMFSQGRFPYQNTETYPFYSSNYPPLFHIFPVPLMWIFGPGYWYGRLLAFVGSLITASLISYAVWRESRHMLLSILSGLAFLASNTVYHIGPLFRQHLTMVLFETAAIIVLANAVTVMERRKCWWQLSLGLGFIIAAGYTKQLAALTAIAALIFLFIRNPRRAILGGTGFAVVGLAIFVWLTFATNGQWWTQAIAANVNEFYPQQAVGLFRLWFDLHRMLIIPAMLLIIYQLYFERLSIYAIWFVVTLANGVASGAWGAGDSYFATTIAAMCILSGVFFARILQAQWDFPGDNPYSRIFLALKPLAPTIVAASAILIPAAYMLYGWDTLKMPTNIPVYRQIATALNLEPNAPSKAEVKTFYDSAGRIAGGYADIGHFTTQADIDAGWSLVEKIKAADKPVISEDAAFSIQAGADVITNPTQLRNLWLNGLYDGSELINMILNQEFAFIIFRAQFYPLPVLDAIGAAYELSESETIRMNGFTYTIYRPKTDYLRDETSP